ncbi:MAG TPA: RDD family protein [Dehalococcoidia bacterium]|nr:RDD family protein [Dehalococcoidia bacterium]
MRDETPDFLADPPLYPSFFARAAAFLLDWAIVLLLAAFVASGVGSSDRSRVAILLTALSAYHIAFLIAMSTTPGKMALRMHVADATGGRLQPDAAILRFLVFLLSLPLLPVNAALVLIDPDRRALHDRVAKTRVRYGRPDYDKR